MKFIAYIWYPIQSDFHQKLHITPSQPSVHRSIPWSHSPSTQHNTLNISPPGFFSSTRNLMFTCFSVFLSRMIFQKLIQLFTEVFYYSTLQ